MLSLLNGPFQQLGGLLRIIGSPFVNACRTNVTGTYAPNMRANSEVETLFSVFFGDIFSLETEIETETDWNYYSVPVSVSISV